MDSQVISKLQQKHTSGQPRYDVARRRKNVIDCAPHLQNCDQCLRYLDLERIGYVRGFLELLASDPFFSLSRFH